MENSIKSDGLNLSMNTSLTEDMARSLLSVVSSATPEQSPVTTTVVSRPSVVFSSTDDNSGSPLQKLQKQVSKMLKGFSPPPEVRGAYNPEDLTSQKRQWARFQLKSLDNRPTREPFRVFESMVIVGLHPQVDAQALEPTVLARDEEDVRRTRNLINRNNQVHAASNLEPQILFAYPPDKPLPLKCKDLLSFCLPGGVQVRAVERTPSFSELNEILLGQEQLKESNQSFVFRLQVADDSTLYGCCVLVEEIVQRPSSLISMLMEEKPSFPSLSRYIMTTPRCYCILSRLPFFDLHFGVLRSILIEERLEWLTEGLDMLNFVSAEETYVEDEIYKRSDSSPEPSDTVDENKNMESNLEELEDQKTIDGIDEEIDPTDDKKTDCADDNSVNGVLVSKDTVNDQQTVEIKDQLVFKSESDSAILPLLRSWLYEGFESSSSYEERSFRSEMHEIDSEEPSSAGHEDSITHANILQWAKDKNHGSLQVICEYYQLKCPERGASLTFQPLEHLHPLNFQRPSEAVLHIAGSAIDVRSLNTCLEIAEVHNALLAEEESTALSVWAVACICGSLRLEHVITFFAAALLEKQILIICSNLGILSASVLSIIPLIRPYHWQSLLMPVLPNDMLDFLDAPVPFVVGVQNRTADLHSRLSNAVIIDVNKNQVKSGSIPQFPQQKELLASLRPYHSMLVGESYLARRRAVYECTDVQVEAAKGFLAVLRSYLDSLCANLRSHTITNVQSNNDKVSLLLRESFIGSFPYRDRAFMKLFVDTQLFSVHTDFVLSFYQKD